MIPELKQGRKRRGERGAMTIEFVGTIFIVLMMLMIAWQAFLGMHALTQANSAARDAARAASLGDHGPTAGKQALSRSLQPGSNVTCPPSFGSSVTCQARVQIPSILGDRFSNMPIITRSATMPRSGD